MSSCYVTADHKIVASVFNPPAGWILAEFKVAKPSIPFNPLSMLADGHIEETRQNYEAAETAAKEFLDKLIKSGHQPMDISETAEYKAIGKS